MVMKFQKGMHISNNWVDLGFQARGVLPICGIRGCAILEGEF